VEVVAVEETQETQAIQGTLELQEIWEPTLLIIV
jgi:hypothetical protein